MTIYPFNFRLPAIYKIVNNITGKVYIGSTINIIERQHKHITKLLKNLHINKKLQNSWNKYGKNAFTFIPIENVNHSNIILREQYYVELYDSIKNGYNIVYPDSKTEGTLGYQERIESLLKSSQKYKEKYPDKVREQNQNWKKKNNQHCINYSKNYRIINLEKVKATEKLYRLKNRDEINRKQREKRQLLKEQITSS